MNAVLALSHDLSLVGDVISLLESHWLVLRCKMHCIIAISIVATNQ